MELKAHLYRLENIKTIHDLAKAGVDPMARPETLSLAQFVALSDACIALF